MCSLCSIFRLAHFRITLCLLSFFQCLALPTTSTNPLSQILAFLPRALRSALDASAADPSAPPLVSLGCSTNAIYALTVLSMWTVCPARFRSVRVCVGVGGWSEREMAEGTSMATDHWQMCGQRMATDHSQTCLIAIYTSPKKNSNTGSSVRRYFHMCLQANNRRTVVSTPYYSLPSDHPTRLFSIDEAALTAAARAAATVAATAAATAAAAAAFAGGNAAATAAFAAFTAADKTDTDAVASAVAAAAGAVADAVSGADWD